MSQFKGVVISAQYGGSKEGIHEEIWILKKLVESEMASTYSEKIDSIHLAFRVDSDMVRYNCSRAEKIRFMWKRREIWIDLGVPISAWKDCSSETIRHNLSECIELGISLIIKAMKKRDVCSECDKLLSDLRQALGFYLATD